MIAIGSRSLVFVAALGLAAITQVMAAITPVVLPSVGLASGSRHGYGVSMYGDTAVVGTPFSDASPSNTDAGSVFVYARDSATGVWNPPLELTAPVRGKEELYGFAVAISGNTLVVSAPYADEVGAANAGAVYVYTRASATAQWTGPTRLTSGNVSVDEQFGYSVALDGDTLVVGAVLGEEGAIANTGVAYVFSRSNGVWQQPPQRMKASQGAVGDFFGNALAIAGDRLVVGAERADGSASLLDSGAAYVFARTSNGWVQQSTLQPDLADRHRSDNFAASVAISGATIVIGQPFLGVGVGSNKGSATVFVENGGTWAKSATLVASDGAADDYFGSAVAISDDRIVVGAYYDNFGTAASGIDAGSAYLFTRAANGVWSQAGTYTAPTPVANALFGSTVAAWAGSTLIGAPFQTNATNPPVAVGQAYVLVPAEKPTLTTLDPMADVMVGATINLTAQVKDVNDGSITSGSVQFFVGDAPVGSPVAVVNGSASSTTTASSPGILAITARYLGDAAAVPQPLLASVSPVRSVEALRSSSTTAFTTQPASSAFYGQALSFAVHVAGPTSGNVVFKDGATQIGTMQPIDGAGNAEIIIDNLATSAVAHSISAEFVGSAEFAPSQSPTAVSVLIQQAPVNLSLVASPSPSAEGDSFMLTATLTPTAGNTTLFAPGNRVAFFDDTGAPVFLANPLVVNGAAVWSVSGKPAGSYNFRATYGGDGNYQPAPDATASHSVLPGADLSITNTNCLLPPPEVCFLQSDSQTTYTITVTNNGPNAVAGAQVVDNLHDGNGANSLDPLAPMFAQGAAWSCNGLDGGDCGSVSSGSGDLGLTLGDLPAPVNGLPASVVITVDAQLSLPGSEPYLMNEVSVLPPGDIAELNMANNSASAVNVTGIFADGIE